jgi:hypothetical protein
MQKGPRLPWAVSVGATNIATCPRRPKKSASIDSNVRAFALFIRVNNVSTAGTGPKKIHESVANLVRGFSPPLQQLTQFITHGNRAKPRAKTQMIMMAYGSKPRLKGFKNCHHRELRK